MLPSRQPESGFEGALYRSLQVGWHHQSIEKRKQEFVTVKRDQNVPEEEITKLMDDNPDHSECQSCNGKCHVKAIGRTFSEDLSMCTKALLCKEVRISIRVGPTSVG